MYAREVTMNLKPNCSAEFASVVQKEIVPLLQKQTGFKDEITLVAPDGAKAVAISLWDQKANADAYNLETFPQVLKALEKVVGEAPQVQTFEVSSSTAHKLGTALPV